MSTHSIVNKGNTPEAAMAWFAELVSSPNAMGGGMRATMYNIVNDRTLEVVAGGEIEGMEVMVCPGGRIQSIASPEDLVKDLALEIARLDAGVWQLVTWRLRDGEFGGENCMWFTKPGTAANRGRGVEPPKYYVSISMDQGVQSATRFQFFMAQIALAMLDMGLDINSIRPVIDADMDCAAFNVDDAAAFKIGMAIGTAREKSADMGMVPPGAFKVELIPHYSPISMGFHEMFKKSTRIDYKVQFEDLEA